MYVHEFTARNFLIHRDSALKLSPITVFVGPNGGGKSALFDAVVNFSMLARGEIGEAFGPFAFSFLATRFHAASPTAPITFEAIMSEARDSSQRLKYSISYRQVQAGGMGAARPTFQIVREVLQSLPENRVLFENHDPDSSPLRNAIEFLQPDRGIFAAVRTAHARGRPEDDQLVSHCAKEIRSFTKFRLNPYDLASSSQIPDLDNSYAPPLGYTGSQLSACLYYMHKNDDPVLDAIRAQVRSLLPSFVDFEFATFGVDQVGFSMSFSDGRGLIPAVRMSHGNLLFLGLMVLTQSSNHPAMLMMEEPENGLTPSAVKAFYAAMRQLAYNAESGKATQILISSHSPFVICDVWNEHEADREFIHLVRVENGHAAVRKFRDAITTLGLPLGKDEQGGRTQLGLRLAEQIMSGYYEGEASAGA